MNNKIMGWQYKTIIRWLMGDTLTAKDLMWPGEMAFTDKFNEQRIKGLNEMLANRLFPGESAIGRRLRPYGGGQPGPPIEIVGLARNSTYGLVGEAPLAFVYRPLAQTNQDSVHLLVQIPSDSPATLQAVRQELRTLDPDLAVYLVVEVPEKRADSSDSTYPVA